MDIVKSTLIPPNNSVLAFCDNSSAIDGYPVQTITPSHPGEPSVFKGAIEVLDVIFTAETHNFPTGVAPKPGAETGTGGRIRDVHATGRGTKLFPYSYCLYFLIAYLAALRKYKQ